MDIEESIKILNELATFDYVKLENGDIAIETLLTAYEKEKGENVKLRLQNIPLIEGELKAYKDRVKELKQELEKEKRLAEANLKDSEEFKENMCNHRCILKSKLEELQQELEKEKEKNKELYMQHNQMIIDILKECDYMIKNRHYMNDVAIRQHAERIKDIAKYYIKEPEWIELKEE